MIGQKRLLTYLIVKFSDDDKRVVLSGDENMDYINAAFIEVRLFKHITTYLQCKIFDIAKNKSNFSLMPYFFTAKFSS